MALLLPQVGVDAFVRKQQRRPEQGSAVCAQQRERGPGPDPSYGEFVFLTEVLLACNS